ncbi:hypothetical protein [Nonomuraea endophytica]|uniref:hypothetical protein n=1 Tax=Nonomuraea endophytica TaxID=714136 RepID=UPI0037CA500D
MSSLRVRALDLAALRAIDAELPATTDPVQRWRLDTDTIVAACPNTSLREMVHALRIRTHEGRHHEAHRHHRRGRDRPGHRGGPV